MNMNARLVALLAGVSFLGLAAFVQGLLPLLEPQSRRPDVTKVVRTDLGELKWVRGEAADYNAVQHLGRSVYIREGCWYCHSQYVRPVTGETRRWGPVSQAGEYHFDRPHLFSTRRIGPDLTRVGLKFSNEWHLAHFWDPRMVVPDSIMPSYRRLFDQASRPVALTWDDRGRRTLERTAESERFFDFENGEDLLLTPNAEGLLYVPKSGRYPVIHMPNDEFTGEAVMLVAPTEELLALVAYLQKLGMNRGKWRDVWEPQRVGIAHGDMPRSEEMIDYGKTVYQRRCIGCHGVQGDGNGPAATFHYLVRPRDFTHGAYKFRDTPSGSLPTDGDLMRVITRGVRGTGMPSWHDLPEKDRLAVIQYVKYELAVDRSDPTFPYAVFLEEVPEPPIHIGPPPPPSERLIARGREAWREAKCWECHGDGGRGDGTRADELEDDFGFPIPAADLTRGQFKSGPAVTDIFRTMTTGLNGTPMPSYEDSLSVEDRWALSYFVLSLAAFRDPLTGEPLNIAPEDRAALNDPQLQTASSRDAYVPQEHLVWRSTPVELARSGGERWAKRRGIELLDERETAAAESAASGQTRSMQ
jgi:cytochrome c oxidase cbb3-type subunit I/II